MIEKFDKFGGARARLTSGTRHQSNSFAYRSFDSSHSSVEHTVNYIWQFFVLVDIPIMKVKIREDWRLAWARRESCDFDEFLNFASREVRTFSPVTPVTASLTARTP